jgi:hypothetical protein
MFLPARACLVRWPSQVRVCLVCTCQQPLQDRKLTTRGKPLFGCGKAMGESLKWSTSGGFSTFFFPGGYNYRYIIHIIYQYCTQSKSWGLLPPSGKNLPKWATLLPPRHVETPKPKPMPMITSGESSSAGRLVHLSAWKGRLYMRIRWAKDEVQGPTSLGHPLTHHESFTSILGPSWKPSS